MKNLINFTFSKREAFSQRVARTRVQGISLGTGFQRKEALK